MDRKRKKADQAVADKKLSNEANAKRLQRARITMFNTAEEVANRKATKLEITSTEDLGEKAANDLAVARASAKLNRKKAHVATISLQRMTADASLAQLRNKMSSVGTSLGEAKADAGQTSPGSPKETKLDQWYSDFQHHQKSERRGEEVVKGDDIAMDKMTSWATSDEGAHYGVSNMLRQHIDMEADRQADEARAHIETERAGAERQDEEGDLGEAASVEDDAPDSSDEGRDLGHGTPEPDEEQIEEQHERAQLDDLDPLLTP